jgi:Family of unknown function (DUF5996)
MVISTGNLPATNLFPSLPLASWQDTYIVLHLWTQIVGKIRLALSPNINHWWQSTLYVTPRGLTTGTIPYQTRTFEIRFDFIESQLHIEASNGSIQKIDLITRSVAEFYHAVIAALKAITSGRLRQRYPSFNLDDAPRNRRSVGGAYRNDNRVRARRATFCLRSRIRPPLLADLSSSRSNYDDLSSGFYR